MNTSKEINKLYLLVKILKIASEKWTKRVKEKNE